MWNNDSATSTIRTITYSRVYESQRGDKGPGFKTLLWCRYPFTKAYEDATEENKHLPRTTKGGLEVVANMLFHITFKHESEDDLNKAILAVENKFKEYYKL